MPQKLDIHGTCGKDRHMKKLLSVYQRISACLTIDKTHSISAFAMDDGFQSAEICSLAGIMDAESGREIITMMIRPSRLRKPGSAWGNRGRTPQEAFAGKRSADAERQPYGDLPAEHA
jgi:hypothetical protein